MFMGIMFIIIRSRTRLFYTTVQKYYYLHDPTLYDSKNAILKQ